jgi:hypothetical protein
VKPYSHEAVPLILLQPTESDTHTGLLGAPEGRTPSTIVEMTKGCFGSAGTSAWRNLTLWDFLSTRCRIELPNAAFTMRTQEHVVPSDPMI